MGEIEQGHLSKEAQEFETPDPRGQLRQALDSCDLFLDRLDKADDYKSDEAKQEWDQIVQSLSGALFQIENVVYGRDVDELKKRYRT